MVELITLALAITAGLGVYLVGIPFIAFVSPPRVRKAVGDFYAAQAARIFEQFSIVRRILSGYDVLGISVDAEKKLLAVALQSSSIPGKGDKQFRFNDPADRIKRLFKKPVALSFEQVPAAVDAELAELGHWVRRKDTREGLVDGETVDPYVEVPDDTGLHIADPLDAFELVPNAVTPENITTTEKLTKRRFEKYGGAVGVRETLATVIGFFVGAGTVVGLRYINRVLFRGDAGGAVTGPTIDVPMGAVWPAVVEAVVIAPW